MSTVPHSLEPVHFSPQTIYCGDCLEILAQFPANSVDLVYIDPPFNSNRNYEVFWGDTQEKRAFDDRYGDALAYCDYMRPRVEQLHRVLKTTGSFYYHCDWHASHYIKVMLDEIFGANYFVNEIIWKRADAHSDAKQGAKHFGRIVDTIFFYSKSKQYAFNTFYQPLPASTAEKWYKHVEPETGRRYNMADLTASKPGGNTKFEFHGAAPPSGRYWAYSKDKMEEMLLAGLIVFSKSGKPYMKRYLDESKGVPLQNIWDDISQLRGITRGGERLGYPTQKPLALLERIIKASSNPGDIVLDAFCGCGTALVAARQLGRRFVGIDISPTSVNVMGTRLEEVCGMKPAPPSMGAQEVADSWNAGSAAVPGRALAEQDKSGRGGPHSRDTNSDPCSLTQDQSMSGQGRPHSLTAYFRYSNLPRSREQLRALPGFEFENWAVLQLGEVLRHHGHHIYAQTNRAKVGDLGLDGRIYLADKVSLPVRTGDLPLMESAGLRGERQAYLPIQVKNTDKVGRPEIDKFAHALQRDGRHAGFFIGWDFSRDVYKEIERLQKLPEGERRFIFTVPVDSLIAETFNLELLELIGG